MDAMIETTAALYFEEIDWTLEVSWRVENDEIVITDFEGCLSLNFANDTTIEQCKKLVREYLEATEKARRAEDNPAPDHIWVRYA